MDERQNDLAMDELQPQDAPEVPEVPESYTAPVEEADYIPESYTAPVEEAEYIPESYTAPVEEAEYIPESYTAPIAVATEEKPVSKAPKKGKKPAVKLNKKLIIGGIAAAVVIALVIVLISLLGGGTKPYGVYVKDGEINLYVKGMKEPVELTSRLWRDADNRDLYSSRDSLSSLVAVRDNGNLVIFPDKFSPYEGSTLYMTNANKPKQEPVKIDSDITAMNLTEDGKTLLYFKGGKGTLHLYDVAKEEELVKFKNVVNVAVNDDMSKLCYMDDDGKVYIWTAETDEVKVAKDAVSIRYFADTDMLFVLTEDGEVLRKTAEMEEAEEIAEDVSRIAAAYATGEVYLVRESVVERNLLEYFDDDKASADAALTQPKKPNYPTSPKKPYYWNYDVYADYEEALAEYNVKYAEYQEEYNKLKNAYNEALEAYDAKLERDEIRARLDRTVTSTEYSLSYFNGTEEVVVSDSITSSQPGSYASDVPVMTYTAYIPQNVERMKMSEVEDDPWYISSIVSENLWNALYGETQLCIALGANSTVVEHTDASNVKVSADGTAVYFLDAPFAAFENGKYTASSGNAPAYDVPAAEAPAYDYPAATAPAEGEEEAEEELIPAGQREYASLYKIAIADGAVGAPELLDSEVSYVYTPYVADSAEDIYYFKAVDSDDRTAEFYCNGLLLAEDMCVFTGRSLNNDLLLFYTDWDNEDRCGTLCALDLAAENAEVIEIGDDVAYFQVTEAGDILFLQDYDWDDHEGTLMLFNMKKGEAVEVDDEIVCLLNIQ